MTRPLSVFCLLLAFPFTTLFADSLELLRKIPHSGYSEGLDWHDGYLWNAFPHEIVKIDPKDGAVLQHYAPASAYSESPMWFLGKLWNVSYSDNGIYAGVPAEGVISFERLGSVPELHAWGMTNDGHHIIVTGNYSHKLYFLNPNSLALERTVTTSVTDLEDLAWDGSGIWASSFTTHRGEIFRINAESGAIETFYSFPNAETCPVIDGIAFDGHALWVTGKECPSIFQLKLPPQRAVSSRRGKH